MEQPVLTTKVSKDGQHCKLTSLENDEETSIVFEIDQIPRLIAGLVQTTSEALEIRGRGNDLPHLKVSQFGLQVSNDGRAVLLTVRVPGDPGGLDLTFLLDAASFRRQLDEIKTTLGRPTGHTH